MVRRENVAVVSIADGSLDASNAKRFKQEVIPALESITKVMLDLNGVEFVDSSGLGVILFVDVGFLSHKASSDVSKTSSMAVYTCPPLCRAGRQVSSATRSDPAGA
jgi:anti-anti-sigma factor